MKNSRFIITCFVLTYFSVLLGYMVYNINADTRKLALYPLISATALTIVCAIFRKPFKRFYKNNFDKRYMYNKQAENLKIKKKPMVSEEK